MLDGAIVDRRFLFLISRFGGRFLHLLLFCFGQLHRPEVKGQLIDLAVETERHLVVVVIHSRAGVDADIEGFVLRQQERNRFRNP